MYKLTKFCGVSIEAYQNAVPIGSGPTPTAYIPLAGGGALDGFGSRQMAPGAVDRNKTVKLWADTQQGLSDLYFTLLALRGKRGALVREMVDGTEHWQYARLVEITAMKDFQPLAQDIELHIVTQEATWRGFLHSTWFFNEAGNYFNNGLAFNASCKFTLNTTTKVVTVTVGAATDPGRAPVRSMIIRGTAGSAAITGLSIARTGGETLTWAGTLAAGNSLIINTGTLQVTNNGADAYSQLTFAAAADMGAWFTLQPGANPITVVRTGGGTGATIDFEFYEAWY